MLGKLPYILKIIASTGYTSFYLLFTSALSLCRPPQTVHLRSRTSCLLWSIPAAMLSASNEALLSEVCSALCSHAWIRSFLLNSDILSDISLLSSPLRLRHALGQTLVSSGVEPASNHAQVLDHRTVTTSLCIPAFSLDGATVGLLVHSRTVTKRWPFLQPAPDALHFARFARFDDAGLLLEAREAAGRAELELVLTRLRSPKRKTEIRLSLRGSAASFAALQKDELVPAMRRRLTQLAKTEFVRKCPRCGADAAVVCRCVVEARGARHLLDFAAHQKNARRFAGEYAGGAAVELFRDGVQALHANLECEEKGEVDWGRGEGVDGLLQNAVRNRLSYYRLGKEGGLKGNREVARGMEVAKEEDEDAVGELASMLTAKEFEDSEIDMGVEKEGSSGGMDRREKNRMAAKRSNLKRKWRNKSLRLNVVIMRQRIAELRERESELRCEQMWLQQRCGLELDEGKVDVV